MSRILGIDPGLRQTGFGVIDQHQQELIYIASGIIKTDSNAPLPRRLCTIFQNIQEISQIYLPQEAAIEKVFVNVNPQSTLLLGQARGAALTALTVQQLNVAEYSALQIKKSLVGHGQAQKTQVAKMVEELLHLNAAPQADAADALAAAICHAHFVHLGNARFYGLKIKKGRFVSAPK